MHLLRRLFLFACVCLVASSASATIIIIQDPSNASFSVLPVTASPFTVTFTDDCQSALTSSQPGYDAAGCFAFTNRTGFDWTGLTLTTTDTPADSGFSCESSILPSQTCTFDPTTGEYTLSFTGGTIPNQTNNLNYYVISESDLDPSSLTFNAVATFAASTPEPSGLVLVGTGLMSAWATMRTRRRPLA